MQVQSISFTGSPIKIDPKSKLNQGKQYLYNEVIDIVKENKVSAEFHTNYINLPDATKNVLEKLKEKNIEFIRII